jgi:hypothetical protein
MYWWNASKLAEDLREGRVDEKERFKYFLATIVAWILAVQLLPFSGGAFGAEGLISAAVNLAMAVLGIGLCYRVNKSGDNTDFIGRTICMGWPIGIRFVAVISAFFLGLGCIQSLHSVSLGPAAFRSAIADNFQRMWNMYFRSAWLGILIILPYYSSICGYLAVISDAPRVEILFQGRKTEWTSGKVLLGILGGIGLFIIVVITIFAETWISSFVGEVLANVLTYLPLAVVWLILVGPDFLRLWRSSQKRPG